MTRDAVAPMLLSAAIIVRDEAEHLDRCLTSLDNLVDEIVVVDTGSKDDSVAIAEKHGAIVGRSPWRNDFSIPRNRSLDLATGEWILYIDADERVRAGNHTAVRERLAAATDHVAFRVRFVPRVNWTPYKEWRLWRHRPDIRFENTIHETMLRCIARVAQRDGLIMDDLDILTIEHFGYEGDQSHKHTRNEPMLRAALSHQPDRPFLYDHLARIYEDLGDHEQARATWRAGMDIARKRRREHPDDRLLWMNLLVHAIVHEDPDGDIPRLIEEVHLRYPGNPAVEFATAVHELTAGDPASASRRLARLLRMTEDEIVASETAYDRRMFGEWAWNALGLAALALDNARGAAAAFRQAEASDPDNPAYRTRRQLAEARARA